MQAETVTYYRQKVNEVLNYIDNNLSGDLNIRLLSEQFGISFFHFHRILKACLKEPLGCYINRIRLETAVRLIRYSDEPISEIAVKIGYNDCSAFTKAFTREFGLSPQEFKNNKTIVLNTNVDYKINDSGKLVSDIKPKVIQLADKHVVFTRFVGEYGCQAFNRAWDDFLGFAVQNNLLGWRSEVFSIYYDMPSETAIDNCATDFCITTTRTVVTSGQISTKTIPGGKYAVFRYKGSYDRLWELYETIFGVWVMNTNVMLSDKPFIEKYLNYSLTGNPDNFLTEIYIPIE